MGQGVYRPEEAYKLVAYGSGEAYGAGEVFRHNLSLGTVGSTLDPSMFLYCFGGLMGT